MRLRHIRGAAGFAGVIALWWAVVAAFDVPRTLVPTPPEVLEAFGRSGGHLLTATWATIGHALGGFAIALAVGMSVAAALAASRAAHETILPLLVALQAVPKVAVAPLLIIWFGFGPSSKVALVALLCFFPIVVSTLAGLTSTPTDLVDLARSLSASRVRTYVKIRIPWAGPQVFTGLKLAISLALIGAVVAQFTSPNSGLGAVIMASRQTADTPLAFAAIVLLAAIGITGFYSLAALERILMPWAKAIAG